MRKRRTPDPRGMAENLKKEERRAAKIRAYWLARGFDVETSIEEMGFVVGAGAAIFSTRSDMVNGFPTRRITTK